MKTKISSSKKVLIAMLTLSVFVIAGIVSLVLVLAASQQSVTSNISVTYVSNNVAAEVTGKYWYTGNSKTTMGTVTFNAGDASSTGTMSPSAQIVLDTTNKRVVFEYAFKNLSNDTAFTVELSESPKHQEQTAVGTEFEGTHCVNMNEQYYVSSVALSESVLGVMDFTNTLGIQPVMKQRAGENDTVYIYVVATIDNLANNATYNGQFAWTLDYVSNTNIKTVYFDNEGGSTAPESMEVVQISGDVVNMPCLFGKPTKTEKGFMGYFTAATEGTQYISLNGSPLRACDFDFTNTNTLHAQWSDLYEISGAGVLNSLTQAGSQQTTLDIPETVTTLGANVFKDNTNLQEVNLPTTLTEVGDNAFDGCTNLTEVNFDAVGSNRNMNYTGESNLERVGAYAFKDCTSLTSIEIPGTATLSTNMFSGCTNLHNITAPIYANFDLSTFSSLGYFTGLTNVHLTINGSVTSIGDYAFSACPGLTSVSIGSSVTSIGGDVFFDCTSLTSVSIGSSVTSIGGDVFFDCISLASITVDANNSTYASQDGILFNKAKTEIVLVPIAITGAVTLPNTLTSIETAAFQYCTSLTSVTIGSSVTSIGSNAFYECTSLASVTIGGSVTSIGDSAFEGCTSLTSITIGGSVTSIDWSAFSNCTSLTSITVDANNANFASEGGIVYNKAKTQIVVVPKGITGAVTLPNTLTSIGSYAFMNCTSLTSVTIGSSVTSIGEWAFDSCTSLASVAIGSSVTNIERFAFQRCSSLINITIPSSVTSIGDYAFSGCTSLTSITVDANNSTYASQDGILFNKAKTQIVLVPIAITGAVTLPNTLTSIGSSAFSSCTSLTSVSIPSSVTSIEDFAFSYCDSLTSITVDESNQNYASDNYGILYNKAKTQIVEVPEGITGSVALPNTLTSIDWSTFSGCTGLTSVSIPSSVTSIGEDAFSYCDSLTSITVDANNANFSSEGGIVYNKAKTEIVAVPKGIAGSVTLPNTLTSIGSYAFMNCTSLTSITIPSSVTSIGRGAFSGCSNLTSVTFEDTTNTWTISSAANKGGTKYQTAYAPTNASTNATNLKSTYKSRYWTKNS